MLHRRERNPALGGCICAPPKCIPSPSIHSLNCHHPGPGHHYFCLLRGLATATWQPAGYFENLSDSVSFPFSKPFKGHPSHLEQNPSSSLGLQALTHLALPISLVSSHTTVSFVLSLPDALRRAQTQTNVFLTQGLCTCYLLYLEHPFHPSPGLFSAPSQRSPSHVSPSTLTKSLWSITLPSFIVFTYMMRQPYLLTHMFIFSFTTMALLG